MHFSFINRIGKTSATGRITVPKQFDSILDRKGCCPLGLSVDINYVLPGGFQAPGRLYQSQNPSTTYYQFYIIEPDDKKKFNQIVHSKKMLDLDFDLSNYCLYVKPSN